MAWCFPRIPTTLSRQNLSNAFLNRILFVLVKMCWCERTWEEVGVASSKPQTTHTENSSTSPHPHFHLISDVRPGKAPGSRVYYGTVISELSPQRDGISSEWKSSRRARPTFLLRSGASEPQNSPLPKPSDRTDGETGNQCRCLERRES